MVETPSNNGKINLYPHLDNDIQYRPNEINRIKDSFIAEICKRETISKTLSKYFPAFYYSDKAVLVLSATIGSVCVASFATVIGTPVRITRASLIWAFFVLVMELLRKPLKTMKPKEKEHNKIVLVVRSKLNGKENIISKALKDNYISHADFTIIMNEERNYCELKKKY